MLAGSAGSSVAAEIDTDFIDPAKTAVGRISPASITNGVTTIASSGVDWRCGACDVAALVGAFIAVDNPASALSWIMAATTALSSQHDDNTLGQPEFQAWMHGAESLAGYPVIVSEYVGTIVVVARTRAMFGSSNAATIFFADEGGIAVDMSREASLQMDNAPTMHVARLARRPHHLHAMVSHVPDQQRRLPC